MGFETLLGNERLKENLRSPISRGRVSHFYLISGPEGSGKHTLAALLAAAILCKSGDRPCGTCAACRRVLGAGHPDFITVDDPEKKTVPVDLVREARTDMYIRPNEADHKIYLFPRAHDMRDESQNALLKILEEPPSYGVFILLTDNPEKLLPTVRSRCTELSLRPLPQALLQQALKKEFPTATQEDLDAAVFRSGGFLGQAQQLLRDGAEYPAQTAAFLQAMAEKNTLLLTQTLAPMEKWKRDQLTPMLQQWVAILESAIASRSGIASVAAARDLAAARSPKELMAAVTALQKAIEYTQSNVSPAAVCGWLMWELR